MSVLALRRPTGPSAGQRGGRSLPVSLGDDGQKAGKRNGSHHNVNEYWQWRVRRGSQAAQPRGWRRRFALHASMPSQKVTRLPTLSRLLYTRRGCGSRAS